MSVERSGHVTKVNAAIAIASGALFGAGVVFPPAIGLGIAVGAVGFIREKSHQLDVQFENLDDYIKSGFEGKVFSSYSDPDEFRREAFVRIPGVVNFTKSESESILRGQGSLSDKKPEDKTNL